MIFCSTIIIPHTYVASKLKKNPIGLFGVKRSKVKVRFGELTLRYSLKISVVSVDLQRRVLL